ncbi:MAG TPA: bifunctional molybdenum cofactor biosynthesis protein MoaC/MoaB [Sediminibacterium sp.]|nr:bifunctional molybdenum cofactor biosynthesis protein MoaC/MoaB [Sediminibacterium sp.]
MVNITHKSNTLRKAIAGAVVAASSPKTIEAIERKQVPKGDVFSFAKVAALFAVKKTSDVIPDCHPLPVEYTDVRFRINGLQIEIEVEVHTIYKTGVEVEAMHGASVAALTLYDMLKPIDSHIAIQNIHLIQKKGGKSSYPVKEGRSIRAAVVVCSDTVFAEKAADKAGLAVVEQLGTYGIETVHYEVIPDEAAAIEQQVEANTNEQVQLLLFIGGTGVSPRDITPDTVRPLLQRELEGVTEAARRYGQERMPYAMLSRSVAGLINQTLVLTLPGSTPGAKEYLDALFPSILHVFEVVLGERHE